MCGIPFMHLVLYEAGGKYKVMIIMEIAKLFGVTVPRSGILLKV